jgi:predicted RNA binding protein YcfA (HicA-like mRNA interferase family)
MPFRDIWRGSALEPTIARVRRRSRIPKVGSQSIAVRVLKEDGWTQTKGGNHNVKMTKPERRPITLPHHGGKDYAKGLWAAILREAGLSREEQS